MYVRVQQRKLKATKANYLQLAESYWDPIAGKKGTRVLYNFGRADTIKTEQLQGLIASISKYLTKHRNLTDKTSTPNNSNELTEGNITATMQLGGPALLDHIWTTLGIDHIITNLCSKPKTAGRKQNPTKIERILFALVAARALNPSSKLAASRWMQTTAAIPRVTATQRQSFTDDACYLAMDWLWENQEPISKAIWENTIEQIDQSVNFIFFDTTNTYFETDTPDEPIVTPNPDAPAGDETTIAHKGFRSYGKSKHHRDDLPQIVIGLAVTSDGIPLRCWVWPGNTTDSPLIRQVRQDIRAWGNTKIIFACDRGFSSHQNREFLSRGGDGYIIGEKLRTTSAAVQHALSTKGAYALIDGGLKVKEASVPVQLKGGIDDRFIVCYNRQEAEKDKQTRYRNLKELEELINQSDSLSDFDRGVLRGQIKKKAHLNRFLRVTATGKLRIDKQAIRQEEKLDGKYLIRTSNLEMTPMQIAESYKQLLKVERCWRTMKSELDLRPVYHHREDRIRAHVMLCFMALLLVRVAELRTGKTWAWIAEQLDAYREIVVESEQGNFSFSTTPTLEVNALFEDMNCPLPAKISKITFRAPKDCMDIHD